MSAIMKSIKPRTCANIMNLIQSILVIKDKREASAIQKLIDEYGYADFYVYCTKDSKGQLHYSKEYGAFYDIYKGPEHYSENGNLNGKVVFKFRCYKVEEIDVRLGHPEIYVGACIDDLWCLDNGYHDKNYMVNAIHISDLEIFDKPKELSEFYGCCDNYTKNVNIFKNINDRYVAQYFNNPKCLKCKHYDGDNWCSKIEESLTKAPQSWCYVEVI